MYCYAGKLLFVDLTTGEIEVRPLPEEYARDYLGGPGLGARILYDEMPAHVGVFDPESVVGWVCGALNDSSGFMTCRYTVVSKSPVTNGWNDANSGGTFGPALRRAGFDGVFFRGISPKPVYLYIDNGKAELRDASAYWGKTTTSELEDALAKELGKKVAVSSIGRAGEQKKYTAAVMNDRHRACGRGGTGAVVGSKLLKAVVVAAQGGKTEIAHRDQMLAANKKMLEWHKGPVAPVHEMFDKWGTGAAYESSVLSGDASVKNWAGSYLDLNEDKINNLTSEAMDKLYRVKKFACFGCPVGCGAVYHLKAEGYDIEDTGRSEYETSGGFGSMVGCEDPLTVNLCSTWCNEYGLDTIAVSGTVAWAMECYEAGVFSKEDLDGIELTWGNHMAVRAITEKICKCEGIGAILANG
ncbi:MAG: aldehyde ferredoxin oxidoreductase, partial [Oscillospiraceae bacterium]|nr:aldehyde ferredoxin oxidoreductase [Oscillospiraceae bacterium]